MRTVSEHTLSRPIKVTRRHTATHTGRRQYHKSKTRNNKLIGAQSADFKV